MEKGIFTKEDFLGIVNVVDKKMKKRKRRISMPLDSRKWSEAVMQDPTALGVFSGYEIPKSLGIP